MIWCIFSDKYMPSFSDFYCAYSNLALAAEAFKKCPEGVRKSMCLVVYEIKLDVIEQTGPVKRKLTDKELGL